MAVDARSRYELYAAFEPHLGDTTAIFLEFLRETSERADLRQWNYERSRREPQKAYRLYGALRRLVGPDARAASWRYSTRSAGRKCGPRQTKCNRLPPR